MDQVASLKSSVEKLSRGEYIHKEILFNNARDYGKRGLGSFPEPNQGFKIGRVDTTLFTKYVNGNLFICQIYVDDIIFGSTNDSLSHEFATMMSREFEMSMIGELTLFLGFKSNK